MANSRTVGDNAPRSVADRIRQNTNSQIQSTLKAPVNTAVNAFGSLSAAEQNRRSVRAAASMLRATQDANYQPSEQTLKDYAALVETVAERRKLGGVNENTPFSKGQLNTDLSPQALLRYAAAQTLTEEVYKGHLVAGRQAIADEIKDVYNDDAEKSQPVVDSVKDVPPFLEDEQILVLPEKEREIYMKDPVDAARLQKKLNSQKSSHNKNHRNETGEIKKNMKDPDWGHKDDDDFKIEQGDIIEYLMKDVILASAAWAGNHVGGFCGTITYELGKGTWHLAKNGALRPIGKALSSAWAYTRETLNGNNRIREQLQNDQAALQRFQEINNQLASDYTTTVDQAQQIQENYTNHPNPAMEKLFRQLTKHYVVIGENDLLFPTNEDDRSEGHKRTHSYAEILGENPSPEKVDNFKKQLKEFQKNSDKAILNGMIEKEKAALGRDLTPQEIQNITTWQKEYNANCEEAVKNNQDSVRMPDASRLGDHQTSYEAARGEVLVQMYMRPQLMIMQAQASQFAAHYSFYMLLEERRRNPDSTMFTDLDAQRQFLERQSREAQVMFYSTEQKRRNGDKNVPSREDLVAMADKQVQASLHLLNEKRYSNPVPNTVADKLNPPTNTSEQESILTAARNTTVEEFQLGQLKDCECEEKSLIQQQMLNGERARKLQERKARMLNANARIKDDPTVKNVDLSKTRVNMNSANTH